MADGTAVRLGFLAMAVTVLTMITIGVFSAEWARFTEELVLLVPTDAGNVTVTVTSTAHMSLWGMYTCTESVNVPKTCFYTGRANMTETLKTASGSESVGQVYAVIGQRAWFCMQLGTIQGGVNFIVGCLFGVLFFYRKSASENTRTIYLRGAVLTLCCALIGQGLAVVIDMLLQAGLEKWSEDVNGEDGATMVKQMLQASPQMQYLTSLKVESYFPWTIVPMLLALVLELVIVFISTWALLKRYAAINTKTLIKYNALMSEEDSGKLEFTDAVEEA